MRVPKPRAISPATSCNFRMQAVAESASPVRAVEQFAEVLDRRQRLHLPPLHEREQVVVHGLAGRGGEVLEELAAGALPTRSSSPRSRRNELLSPTLTAPPPGARPRPAGTCRRRRAGSARRPSGCPSRTDARPSQPVWIARFGSAECQMSIASKCERSGFGIADALHHREVARCPTAAGIPACRSAGRRGRRGGSPAASSAGASAGPCGRGRRRRG